MGLLTRDIGGTATVGQVAAAIIGKLARSGDARAPAIGRSGHRPVPVSRGRASGSGRRADSRYAEPGLGAGWLAGPAVAVVAVVTVPDRGEPALGGIELGGDQVLDVGLQRTVRAHDELAQAGTSGPYFRASFEASARWYG